MPDSRMICRLGVSWLLLAFCPPLVWALEGMWPPDSGAALHTEASALGLSWPDSGDLQPDQPPLSAVVSLGTCTGVLVSPDGLILTNQHCLMASLQVGSETGTDLLKDGYLARKRSDELALDPNLRIYLLNDQIDATRGVLRGAVRSRGRTRYERVDRVSKRMVDHCERQPDLRCELLVSDGGGRFELVRQIELRDIRLVYAPPANVANFGGEFDNWMWPRHAADVALIRAYVAPDGSSREYAADNVPYRSRHWLRTSRAGYQPGDPVWLAGFPVRTHRNRTAAELANVIEWQYPRSIQAMNEVMAAINLEGKRRPEVMQKYGAILQSLSNYEKNFRGQLSGFAARRAIDIKRREETKFRDWLKADSERAERYWSDVEALDDHLARWQSQRERDFVYTSVLSGGGAVAQALGLARDLYRWSLASQKPAYQRDFGYQRRDAYKFAARVESFDKRFDLRLDQRLFEIWLSRYLALPGAQRIPELDRWLGVPAKADNVALADVQARIDALFRGTGVGDLAVRRQWLHASPTSLERSKDPMMQLAITLYPAIRRFEKEFKVWNGDDARFRAGYLDAYQAYRDSLGHPYYPDANGSLRLTLGSVRGDLPGDLPVSRYQTSMAGLLAKVREERDFQYPEPMLSLARRGAFGEYADPKLGGDLPVNFLTDLDITGGNSGSPTINAEGELIGLAFDTTWDSVPSNWVYDSERTRTIHVDARYWLWLLDDVLHADALLVEMGVPPKASRLSDDDEQ